MGDICHDLRPIATFKPRLLLHDTPPLKNGKALMKKTIALLSLFLFYALAGAAELPISSKEPVIVVAPDQWVSTKDKPPGGSFPFETFRVAPPAGRNAQCLFSILGKNKQEFADAQFLKKVLRGDSQVYVNSPDELSKIELKELKLNGGLGYYANFVDPDLVGKPVKEGSYKTATPIILSLGSRYLIKVTILCDQIGGADYRDALKLVQSIKIKTD